MQVFRYFSAERRLLMLKEIDVETENPQMELFFSDAGSSAFANYTD
jgi:hypothetical protein